MIVMIICWCLFAIINPFFSKKNYGKYLSIIAITYAFIAYHIRFTSSMDISRVTTSMKYWYDIGILKTIKNQSEMDPLSTIYYYFIGLSGDFHLIPAISILIIYGFSFALIYRCSIFFNLSKKEMNIITFLFLSLYVFFYAYSNIRIYMCFSILSFFIYMELIEDKCHIICWPFYIAAIFFHYASLPFVLLRVLVYKYKSFTLSRIFVIGILVVLFFQLPNFLSLFDTSSGLLHTLSYKLNSYSKYTTFGIEYFIISLIKVIPIFIVVILNLFSKNIYFINEKKFLYFVFITSLLYIFMLSNYQFVIRTPNFLITLFVVVYCIITRKIKNNKMAKNNVLYEKLSFNYNIIIGLMFLISIINIFFDSYYFIYRSMIFDF